MEACRAEPTHRYQQAAPGVPWAVPPVSPQILVAGFFVLDAAGVLLGLWWLHRQRCIADVCDMRFRNHPDKMRRTLGG
jgi:hypothetical protein